MKCGLLCCAFAGVMASASAQKTNLTPGLLWQLHRVNGMGLTKNNRQYVYSTATPDTAQNKFITQTFTVDINTGAVTPIENADSLLNNKNISPDGKYIIYDKEIALQNVKSAAAYPELAKSNAYLITSLNYRHWDKWNTGTYSHVFVAPVNEPAQEKDLMPGELFDCPQKAFGGDEDHIWSPDSKHIIYVSKKKAGTAYALSTNTDLYEYDMATGITTNLTKGMVGYDMNPAYNAAGTLAWLSMKRDGLEADKQDLFILQGNKKVNLTGTRQDLHLEGFVWDKDGKSILFWAPVKATRQLFEITIADKKIRQITTGDFQYNDITGQAGNTIFVTRTDLNHAPEIYGVDKITGQATQLTHANDSLYSHINMCNTVRRFVTTTDGQQMPVWVVYPPNFDEHKKYPALLYCSGGPQGTTTHYSFRWNFQLMASQGYIVVIPDRRGIFGDGVQWTAAVSRHWGGQVMQDFLSAIDNIAKEKYVDPNRLGCAGASFGGYAVYMLESLHKGRFKTFVAHDGIFDLKSWIGTTEEVWFARWDIGGWYWDRHNSTAQKSYRQYSPSSFVAKWKTPILIVQGGIDYRVPVEQGLQAFQAAQLQGVKSKLLYFPDEGHWVSGPQNSLVWQHEFFGWLKETLK